MNDRYLRNMATAANPYAGNLADRGALGVLRATPGRLREAAERLRTQALLEESVAPGKWSARKILCHLADCEIAFGYRWRQVAAQPGHVIQTFDQDLWAAPYDALAASEALECFCALRQWNCAWVASLPRDAFVKPATHPERGELTLTTLLETTAGHDLHHFAQLDRIMAKGGR
ncbi:MAG: DinB family protein [Candidatus Udaeobacter sp.]